MIRTVGLRAETEHRTAGRRRSPAGGRDRRTRRLAVEPLEDRLTPNGGYLLVASADTNSVLRYDEATGRFVDTFVPKNSGGLTQPYGLVFGPTDHNLYVSSGLFGGTVKGAGRPNAVLSYDGGTGSFLDAFADDNRLTSPRGVVFGPDGNLYVADGTGSGDGRVVEFNGATGAYIKPFVDIGGNGGLSHPQGLVFGPDGNGDGKPDLYVSSAATNSILLYDGTSGHCERAFVASGFGGLDHPGGLTFGPDGNLYVANIALAGGHTAILRFDGASGAPKPLPGNSGADFIAVGVGGLMTPTGVLFGPDGTGDGHQDLYVTTCLFQGSLKARAATSTVLRFDGVTGSPAPSGNNNGAIFVAAGSGGLDDPVLMTFTETNPTTLAYTGTATAPLSAASTARAADPNTISSLQFAILPLAPATDAEGSANGWLSDPMARPVEFVWSPHKDSQKSGRGLRIGLVGPRLP